MSLKRLFSWLVLLLAATVMLLTVMLWSAKASKIDVVYAGSRIAFTASHRAVWPGQCATLRWNVDSPYEFQINDEVVGPVGQRQVCPETTTGYVLRLVDDQGHIRYRDSVYVRILLTTRKTQVVGVGLVALFALLTIVTALVGDLPGLSLALKHPRQTVFWRQASRVGRGIGVWWRHLATLEYTRTDIGHITALVLIPFIPLVLLRYVGKAHSPLAVAAFAAVWLGVLASWIRRTKFPGVRRPVPGRPSATWHPLAVSALLVICVMLGFYAPMHHQFWMGGDEAHVLRDGMDGWHVTGSYDDEYSRPLTPLGSILAVKLTPDSVAGFLWFACVERLLSAALIFGILTLLAPRLRLIALAAAVLFVVNPSEPTRYLALYMQGYNMGVFLTLLAFYLFLRSFLSSNRLMLVLACGLLACSFLVVETGFPLSLIWPVALWLAFKRRARTFVWIYAWFVTVSLFAVRLLQFNFTPSPSGTRAYQQTLIDDQFGVTSLGSHFLDQLGPAFRYLQVPRASAADWAYGAVLLGVVVVVLGALAPRFQPEWPRRRHLVYGLGGALAAVVLGVTPYLALEGILSTIRTQFYAAPAQAVALALLIGLVGTWFSPRLARGWVVAATGVVVLLSTAAGLAWKDNRPVNPDVEYGKTVRIVRQVVAEAPELVPDSLLIFVVKEGDPTPLGWNYYVFNLTSDVLGIEGYQVNYTDSLDIRIDLATLGRIKCPDFPDCWYSRLVVFEVDADGHAQLLEHLPESLLPEEPLGDGVYNPRARILNSGPKHVPFF